jgi:hypothetical protein
MRERTQDFLRECRIKKRTYVPRRIAMDDLIKKAEELAEEKALEEGKGLLGSNPLLQQVGKLIGQPSAPAASQESKARSADEAEPEEGSEGERDSEEEGASGESENEAQDEDDADDR